MEALRGSIEIASKPGAGLTVTLRLPLTLAIIDGLLVRVGGAHFVLPLANSLECVELTRQDIQDAHGNHLANVRGELIPYIRLSEYFQMETARPEREQIMVVETEHGHYGFVVDQVLGDHQTVIKNLGRLYRNVQVVSGATILGNGTVALILDPHRLVQNAVQSMSQKKRCRRPEQSAWTGTESKQSTAIRSKRKTESMLRKVNGKNRAAELRQWRLQPFWNTARKCERARAGSARKRRTWRCSGSLRRSCAWWRHPARAIWTSAARPTSFRASHREMVQGINEMLDAILLPIGEGNRILAQISERQDRRADRADLQGRSRKDEAGRQQRRHGGAGPAEGTDAADRCSREGQLSERGKPEQFQGAYADIVRGVNAMLDAILLPIGEGNRILAQISDGKIDELIAQPTRAITKR